MEGGGGGVDGLGTQWGDILSRARALGVSGTTLAQAMQAAGSPWGDLSATAVRSAGGADLFPQRQPFAGYTYSPERTAAMAKFFPGYTPGGATPFGSYLRSIGVNQRFGKNLVGTSDPQAALDAIARRAAGGDLFRRDGTMKQRFAGLGGVTPTMAEAFDVDAPAVSQMSSAPQGPLAAAANNLGATNNPLASAPWAWQPQ